MDEIKIRIERGETIEKGLLQFLYETSNDNTICNKKYNDDKALQDIMQVLQGGNYQQYRLKCVVTDYITFSYKWFRAHSKYASEGPLACYSICSIPVYRIHMFPLQQVALYTHLHSFRIYL